MTTWLITGCSTGLGRALAIAALAEGDQVVLTARDVRSIRDIADEYPETAVAATVDVTEPGKIAAAIAVGIERFGSIDVLVNNAGYGYRAAVEEGDDAAVRLLFETNFFAVVDAVKAVLPHMRARRSGTIVNVSSIAATIGPAGSGYYAAAKSAIEGLTSSLRKELQPLGITAFVLEPGGFRTDFTGRSLQQAESTISDYAHTAGARRKSTDPAQDDRPGDPAKAAAAIIATVKSDQTPELLVLGPRAVSTYHDALVARVALAEQWRSVGENTGFSGR